MSKSTLKPKFDQYISTGNMQYILSVRWWQW